MNFPFPKNFPFFALPRPCAMAQTLARRHAVRPRTAPFKLYSNISVQIILAKSSWNQSGPVYRCILYSQKWRCRSWGGGKCKAVSGTSPTESINLYRPRPTVKAYSSPIGLILCSHLSSNLRKSLDSLLSRTSWVGNAATTPLLLWRSMLMIHNTALNALRLQQSDIIASRQKS